MTQPFITFYTPHFRRPRALAKCLASVQMQTAVAHIEQIVIVDHIGRGIEGMYAEVPTYHGAVHGRYVHMLCDDDVLASKTVVAEVETFAIEQDYPPLILVAVNKGGMELPVNNPWPPMEGYIDLGCAIVRQDIWKAHPYGLRYEGDFDQLWSIFAAGIPAAWCDVLFLRGAVSRGEAEAVA